jgi:hypothetical protein
MTTLKDRLPSVALAMTLILSAMAMAASAADADFGFLPGPAGFDGSTTNADGSPATQAGSHPYAVTTSFALNTATNSEGTFPDGGDIRDIDVGVPPGLVGDPNAIPQCPSTLLFASGNSECPDNTAVGVVKITISGGSFTRPLYNLIPPSGVVAEFGTQLLNAPILFKASVRSGGDYGLSVSLSEISQAVQVTGASATFWGVPAAPSHDGERGQCEGLFGPSGNTCPAGVQPKPFLTLPTSCVGPQPTTIGIDSWSNPGTFVEDSFVSHDNGSPPSPIGMTGCEKLDFEPSFTIAPDTSAADTPAGLTFELKIPQEGLLGAESLAAADLKDTTVTLPEGVAINPGQAAGLLACQGSETGIGTEGPPSCPSGSKVGTVQITTPLLTRLLEGNVYVMQSNPPDLKLLVAASSPIDGIYVKLVGDVHLDESTGRLTTTFTNTPQLPFSDLKLSFSGGAQAALTTPPTCGLYSTTSDFAPWSGQSDSILTNSFPVETGPGGSACTTTLPFTPQLTAGATTDQAGGFTDFSLLLQRGDGQQRVSKLSFKTPEGLLGMISKVPLCGEPQAARGTCSAASQIGHTVVQAGPGPYPLLVPEAGQLPAPIYLTGGYKGAPYGLSIAVPVIAGPFNLGTVVVRASIAVDPYTSQLTITTDPLPSILDGVPTDLRTINAVIDRPGFMFNPTNCSPQTFSGIATSTQGAQAAISSHFQMGSCQSLKFAPDFRVSTSGRTSKADGASLDAKILYPTGVLGANQASSQANVASVKVDLPKQLPSRLTTLQKACTAAQFDANPAGCPAASVVGHATAITPVLPVPVTGPAYFVSHGGEAFPSLIIVLQGYGVTVDLVGTTFISKAGITSSTFKQVPDVPITSFDLNLPEGRYSALAANGNLCASKLKMPTAFTGQNGAVIHETTPITVTGCAKAKALTRAQKLTKALKACKKKPKAKRAACQQQAHEQYALTKKKAKKK